LTSVPETDQDYPYSPGGRLHGAPEANYMKAEHKIKLEVHCMTTLSCFMIAAIELRVVGTKHGTGIGSGNGSGNGVGALNIAVGAGTKTGTGSGRTVLDPPPVSTVSPSSSVYQKKTFNSIQYTQW